MFLFQWKFLLTLLQRCVLHPFLQQIWLWACFNNGCRPGKLAASTKSLLINTQYSACVVAIAPLQKLWIKAGEHQLQHCFGVSQRVHELLALVTPETRLLSVFVDEIFHGHEKRV